MIKIKQGVSRTAILLPWLVIKIPSFFNHRCFLNGCVANWKERWFYKAFQTHDEYSKLVVPSLFCSYFGLIQLQKRAKQVDYVPEEMKEPFKNFGDLKTENFGLYKNQLVLVDYE